MACWYLWAGPRAWRLYGWRQGFGIRGGSHEEACRRCIWWRGVGDLPVMAKPNKTAAIEQALAADDDNFWDGGEKYNARK